MKRSKAMRIVAECARGHLQYVEDDWHHKQAAQRLLSAIVYPEQARHVLTYGTWAYEDFYVGKWQKRLERALEKLAEEQE